QPQLGEVLLQRTRLAVLHARLVEYDDAAVLGLGGQRVLERERAHLLRQTDRVAARGRAERAAATAEQIDPRRAVAGRTGALLPVHLLAGTVDLGAVPAVMGTALALGELPVDATVQDVRARLETENRIRQLDRAGRLAVERHDLQFHVTHPPSRQAVRRHRRRHPRPPRPAAGGTCPAWAPPSAASSLPRRAA